MRVSDNMHPVGRRAKPQGELPQRREPTGTASDYFVGSFGSIEQLSEIRAANDERVELPKPRRSTMWVRTYFGDFNVTPGRKPCR